MGLFWLLGIDLGNVDCSVVASHSLVLLQGTSIGHTTFVARFVQRWLLEISRPYFFKVSDD